MQGYRRFASLTLLGMAIVLLDFISKSYIYYLLPIAAYPFSSGIAIFQNFLGGIDFFITLTVNRGAAWGFFADFQPLLVTIRILVIAGLLLYILFFNKNRRAAIPLVLIVSGAIGNIVDYFVYGFVVDFFHVILWGYDFPVFNVADISITFGVLWLFCFACVSKKNIEEKNASEKS